VRIAADDHRLAAEARAIPFFDGGVKRIHVDVQDHLASVKQRLNRVMLEAHRITITMRNVRLTAVLRRRLSALVAAGGTTRIQT
jgi:hypothetical protein